MASKNDPKERKGKLRTKFFVGEIEVSPVRYGRKMMWLGTDGVYYRKWETKK